MNIQWFPGHMAKARREIEARLKQIDVVYELVDARLPMSSRNPMLDEIVQGKPRLILMMKADLADEPITQRWRNFFYAQGMGVIPLDAKKGKGFDQIAVKSEKQVRALWQRRQQRGIRSRKIRAMVLGIPNVGKSTLINRLAKRSATSTGDRPGITKAQQWIRMGNLELLDTPGILWPKFDDEAVGMRLALSGAIKEEILPIEEVAYYGLQWMAQHYGSRLHDRYQVDPTQPAEKLLEELGRKRGCLQKGGEVNREKAAEIFLHDFRGGRLGTISLETPQDWVIATGEKDDTRN